MGWGHSHQGTRNSTHVHCDVAGRRGGTTSTGRGRRETLGRGGCKRCPSEQSYVGLSTRLQFCRRCGRLADPRTHEHTNTCVTMCNGTALQLRPTGQPPPAPGFEKKINPLGGVWSQQPGLGGWMGGGRRSEFSCSACMFGFPTKFGAWGIYITGRLPPQGVA